MKPQQLAQARDVIAEFQASKPEVGFWIGVFKDGGIGDLLTACAVGRAAARHWRTRLDCEVGVIVVCNPIGQPAGFDIGYNAPGIDWMLLASSYPMLRSSQIGAPQFDVMYADAYAMKTTFKDPLRFALDAYRAAERLGQFQEIYDHTRPSHNLLGKQYIISQWDLMSVTLGFSVTPDDLAIQTECARIAGYPESPILRTAAFQAARGASAGGQGRQDGGGTAEPSRSPFAGCVTIHNGMGSGGKTGTKRLPPDVPPAIAAALLARGETVVQLGTRDADIEPPIPGCVDLRGLRMPESARVIRDAKMHIDVEGGLVYVARALRTPSVVFFGPTPPVVFGFDGNVNYSREVCPAPHGPHCWWATPTWSSRCPHGCEHCLNFPQPAEAARIVGEALDSLPVKHSDVARLSETDQKSQSASDLPAVGLRQAGRRSTSEPAASSLSTRIDLMRAAQCLTPDAEQQTILEFFLADPQPGRFLDIGACDGIKDSNTRGLAERGWAGLCIEANPANFVKLVENSTGFPGVNCLCAAMSDRAGATIFREAENPECGTCNTEAPFRPDYVRSYTVGSVTTEQILESFGRSFDFVDFVSLDIEGMDLEVLPTLGPLLEHTRLLCLEIVAPDKPFDPEYKAELCRIAAGFGFTRELLQSVDDQGRPRNVLLARPSVPSV